MSRKVLDHLLAVGRFIFAVGFAGAAGCSSPEDPTVASFDIPVTAVMLTGIGATQRIEVAPLTKSGARLSNVSVTWSTSNSSVATVTGTGTSATVTSVGAGSATVTARSGSATGTIQITVQASVLAVTMSGSTQPLPVLDSRTISATVQADLGVATGVAWSQTNPSVATLAPITTASGSPVTVTGVSAGTTTIRAAAVADPTKFQEITLVISPATVASVVVTLGTNAILTNQSTQATVGARDRNGGTLTGRTVSSFTSSNVLIATVTPSGLVTGVGQGTATISATVEGVTGTSSTLTVSLAPVATVTVAPAFASLAPGGTLQLAPTLRDAGGNVLTGRTVSWSSSNSTNASVSNGGLVTAVTAGTLTTITATSETKTGSAQIAVCSTGLTLPANVNPRIVVSASQGNDANGGSCAAPFKTITRAVAAAQAGDVIWVAPGTYDAALGEVFPIMLPANVTLLGDEANKGQGSTATRVVGGEDLVAPTPCAPYGATIYAGDNAVIAGFELTNSRTTFAAMTLLVCHNAITIRNNSLVNNNSGYSAIYISNGAVNLIISGNRITDNVGSLGLGFIGGGTGSKVENNVIVRNQYGVEYDSFGGDLGGGAAGSTGGNIISCNVESDLFTGVNVSAANNFWDHVPPTTSSATRLVDIFFNGPNATVTTTGGQVAVGHCP